MIKVRAEFSSSITANTIMVQMPLPKYTTRSYSIPSVYYLIRSAKVCDAIGCFRAEVLDLPILQ